MKYILTLFIIIVSFHGFSQDKTVGKPWKVSGVSVINPMAKPTQFAPNLKNLEAPKPGGDSYHEFLNQQKVKSAKLFNQSKNKTESINFGEASDPIIMNEMGMRKYIAQINLESVYNGGTPLDNTMALNSDYLLASVNSFLWAWDLKGDSNLFVDEHGSTFTISFAEFGKDYILDPATESPFDPKLVYVPQYDRFIFLFLSGRTPTDSKTIIGFSTTNDPRDPWNVYKIEGNPRGVDQWSDFPMIAYDAENLFLSLNLLKANTSWQLGFQGSVVWKIPLSEGFSGATDLNTTLFDQITYGGNYIRNLTPIQSHQPDGLGMDFLSNRNFDLQNDSLFLIDISSDNQLSTETVMLPINYGMPPNGIQADDDPNDATDGLQTNDARFLAAVSSRSEGQIEYIEFVGNTVNPSSGRSGIFHGRITGDNLSSLTQDVKPEHITAKIIGMDSLDFGYPSIVHLNNGQNCYQETFIAFNHTSFTTFAGISGIRYSPSVGYSNIIRLKEGDNYVRRMSGSYERWGDYFGLQSIPGFPNQVYTAGYYGTSSRSSSTWFSKLSVSDDTQLLVGTQTESNPYFINTITVNVDASQGFEPYTYQWTNGNTESSSLINIVSETTQYVTVTDSKGCSETKMVSLPSPTINSDILFPNPVVDEFQIHFKISSETEASFEIYDMTGKLIQSLGNQFILEGSNVFSFSTRPLLKGAYIIMLKDSEENIIIKKSFVKL